VAHGTIRMLVVEDDRVDQLAFERFVRRKELPYAHTFAASVNEARKALQSQTFDVVLMDYLLGEGTALDLFGEVPMDVPIVIVTGGADAEIAVQAMKLGAADYLMKDPEGHYLKTLPITVANAIKVKDAERALRKAYDELEKRVSERTAELREANAQLVQEIAERKRAEGGVAAELKKFRALYDVAVAMTGERSLDENLSLLVEQGRKLLSADTAWIALCDETTGDMYLHTASGERLDEHHEPHIPFGAGLGGEVVRTGRGAIVHNYYEEVEPSLHASARSEGLVSGIAVPIQVGQTHLGVLYAFNREQTSFSQSDLDTLSLLGNLAAVEISRERAEMGLRESEDRYRSLVENMDIGVTLVDSDHNIVMTNAARAKMLNKTSVELVGKKCYVESGRAEEVCSFCPGVQAMTTGQPFEVEIESAGNHDTGSWMRIRAFPTVGADGAVSGYIELTEDISNRKLLEEQLRHTAKMEAIGLLAGGVAHDFNNLLTAIIGYSDMALQQMSEKDPSHSKVILIADAAHRAAALTRQLLAFSRKQVLDMKVFDLNVAIADFEKLLRRLIGADIELSTVLNPSLGRVRADPGQIEQILMNLAVNARDAMPEGGRLTIETANVVLDQEYTRSHAEAKSGPHVTLAVSDTGVGMDGRTRDRIFEPFFTTKEKGRGTGLGLATVYGIVKQHQGHISVHSEPGRGTTFKVFLPQVQELVQPLNGSTEVARQHRGTETVLVVEDEDVVRKLTTEVMESLGYRVLVACGPEEALKISREYQGAIHLVLADVILPVMDGTALVNRLYQNRPEVKALYVSGYAENAVFRQGVFPPDGHFLQKPFTLDRLARKVRDVLDEPGPMIPPHKTDPD
jgi:two-component system, cell cycle sensor histidine kinase and response regulator CckA